MAPLVFRALPVLRALPVAPLVFRASSGLAAGCAGRRWLFCLRCLWCRWFSGRCRAWLRGVPGSLRCLWCRWCSGGRVVSHAGLAAVCAGERRPAGPGCFVCPWAAARPRAFGSARRLVVRPGPATAHGHRSQAPRRAIVTCHRVLARRHSNFACSSPIYISNFGFMSLESQRFWTLLKVHAIELHAILLSAGPAAHGHCGQDVHAG